MLLFRLEDPDAEEVKDFVQKQVNLTESVLKQCETREKLQKKLTEFYDYPKYDAPFREGDKFFYFHNTGLQPQKVLYMQVHQFFYASVYLYIYTLHTHN